MAFMLSAVLLSNIWHPIPASLDISVIFARITRSTFFSKYLTNLSIFSPGMLCCSVSTLQLLHADYDIASYLGLAAWDWGFTSQLIRPFIASFPRICDTFSCTFDKRCNPHLNKVHEQKQTLNDFIRASSHRSQKQVHIFDLFTRWSQFNPQDFYICKSFPLC